MAYNLVSELALNNSFCTIITTLQLNPAKLEKGADTVVNLKQLLEFLFEGVDAIVKSPENCPR